MEDLLKYENRGKLYESLKDLGLKLVDEKYDDKAFGNFYVTLAAKEFLIRYVNDRHFLTIEFLSNYAAPGPWGFPRWLDLSFLMNLINNAPELNPGKKIDNLQRITELNNFLKKEYHRICDLLNKTNYKITLDKIDSRLKVDFRNRYPEATKDWQ